MSSNIKEAILAVGSVLEQNKLYLTELDAAIGDGDHGINMARGFEAVRGKIQGHTGSDDIGTLLKLVGMTLVTTVGGASGPLYGTAFMRAGGISKDKVNLDKELAIQLFNEAINGIKDRGKAVKGEKTMLDALEPAFEAFKKGIDDEKDMIDCLDAACSAAEEGVEYTKTIIATKGRASYLGERSLGHQDPGATSSLMMLKTLLDFCQTHK